MPMRTNSAEEEAREARNTLNLRGWGAARLTGVGRSEGLRLWVGGQKKDRRWRLWGLSGRRVFGLYTRFRRI